MNLVIDRLDSSVPDGYVVVVHWRVSLERDGVTVAHFGETYFPHNPDSGFIPYKDLTEDLVKNWVIEQDGEEISRILEMKFEALKSPERTKGLPWVNNEEQS